MLRDKYKETDEASEARQGTTRRMRTKEKDEG